MLARLCLIALSLLCLAAPALAHQTGFGFSEVLVEDREVAYLVEIPGHYLPLPGVDPNGPPVEAAQVQPHMQAVSAYLKEHVGVQSGSEAPEPVSVELADAGRSAGLVGLVLRYEFKEPPRELVVRHDVFDPKEPSYQNLAKVHVDGRTLETVFKPDRTVFRFDGRGWLVQAWSFLLLGIEHIFTGYDHLAFVLVMILVGQTLGQVAKIVTGFTVAHSLTLVLAALGVVSLPGRLVESVIALSIAVVAAENFVVKAPDKRWIVAFVFGLVHGFGFSGVLRELGLPTEGLVSSLLAFNLGVEVGQLAVVAAIFPLVLWLRRTPWHMPVVRAASGAVLVMGLIWFGERLLG